MKTTERGVGSKADLFCKECGNSNPNKFIWKGSRQGGKRYKCKICDTWGTAGEAGEQYDYTFTDNGESAQVDAQVEKRIVSEKDLIEYLKIDTRVWRIKKFVVGKSEGYRKDRQVKWVIVDGQVVTGEVNDSGKLLVQPIFTVKVWLERKTPEIRNQLVVDDLKKDAIRFVPKYPKIRYHKNNDGLLYEICAFDLHLGKLTWAEESGENSDLKTQTKRITEIFEKLISYSRNYPIERILIPFGGDFYNTDNKFDTTTAGTPQSEDTRYQKTFRAGRILATNLIDMCSQIAPIDVLVLSGNHDEQKAFYLGDALSCWFHNNPNVNINNEAKRRKYYAYGKNLVMFVHGSEEKLNKLPGIMAMEVPDLWAASTYREVHSGDKHHREDILFKTHEDQGVVVRILSSPSPIDAWHASKGFIGALQGAESFLWHKDDGIIAQFTASATPNRE